MLNMIYNAWQGWHALNDNGKLPALLLISLLIMWRYYRKEEGKGLYLYAVISTFACICPLTAAVLMLYQTKFYDYQWVWSMVPMTAIIALGCTVFGSFLREYGKRNKWGARIVAVAFVLMVVACGNYRILVTDKSEVRTQRKEAMTVLDTVKATAREEDKLLAAPKEIIAYAGERNDNWKLLYGRNMWEEALNAYSYDTYSAEVKEIYEWLQGEENAYPTEHYTKLLEQLDVGCVLIPASWPEETLQELKQLLGSDCGQAGAYYMWIL